MTLHQIRKKAFTLIELVIVIAIIAVLSVASFLILTKWLGKTRDSRKMSDISTISNSLNIYLTEKNNLPLPDSYSGIYDSGYSLSRFQGFFTDSVSNQLSNITRTVKDPQGNNYGYSVSYDRKYFQIGANCENMSYSISDKVYAVSSVFRLQGNFNNFLITHTGSIYMLWNVPSLFLYSGTQFTGGNNNFLQDNKTIDNTYFIQNVDVTSFYTGGDTFANAQNIISMFSGCSGIKDLSGVVSSIQNAAGAGGVNPIINCGAGFHVENNQCISNISSCTVLNGNGQKTWNGSGWGNCIATSCTSPSVLYNGTCRNKLLAGEQCSSIYNSFPADYGADNCNIMFNYNPDGTHNTQTWSSPANSREACQIMSLGYCANNCQSESGHGVMVGYRWNGSVNIDTVSIYYCD